MLPFHLDANLNLIKILVILSVILLFFFEIKTLGLLLISMLSSLDEVLVYVGAIRTTALQHDPLLVEVTDGRPARCVYTGACKSNYTVISRWSYLCTQPTAAVFALLLLYNQLSP